MSSKSGAVAKKAWIVATSIGAVEALKDQLGLCRWNYPLRSLHQHAKSKLISSSYVARNRWSSTSAINVGRAKKTEAALDKIVSFNCWGPDTVRF